MMARAYRSASRCLSGATVAASLVVAALLALTTADLLGQQAGVGRDARAEPVRGTGAIAGFLVDESTGQPLRGAEVSLSGDTPGSSRVTRTDQVGAFMFPNLPAGRYQLAATKAGYVRAAYGAKRYDRPGTPIQLAAGQTMTSLKLATHKGGVITGQIVDETGQPAFGVQVRALEYRTVLGERRLTRVRPQGTGLMGLFTEETDDRGVYRLYGLPPGEYVVVATPRMTRTEEVRAMTDAEIRDALQAAAQAAQGAQATVGAASVGTANVGAGSGSANTVAAGAARRDPGVTVGYTPVFYPGTTSAAGATSITLGRGEERAGVDFQVQLVQTARIEGVVIPPAGVPAPSVTLMLVAADELGTAGLLELSTLNRATADAQGKFAFRSVPPGRYTLTARAVQPEAGAGGRGDVRSDVTMTFQSAGGGAPVVMSGGSSQQPAFWASNDITVSGQDVENVVLSLQPAMTMNGQVRFEGTATPPRDLSRVRLSLQPAPSPNMQISTGFPGVTVMHGGEFRVTNLTPGKYMLTGSVPAPPESFTPVNWRLKSAIVDGRDILDFPLEVGPYQNLADAVVTFSDVTQSVTGVLQDASGRPAPDYTIVVFAAEPAYWLPRARRIRTVRPGTDGRFTIEGLPAGSYRMAAVTDMADEEAFDPAFLEQLVQASFAFTLADGEKKAQDMRIAGGGL